MALQINEHIIMTTFIVIEGLNEQGILGNYFLDTYKTTIEYEKKTITFQFDKEIRINFTKTIATHKGLQFITTGIITKPIKQIKQKSVPKK